MYVPNMTFSDCLPGFCWSCLTIFQFNVLQAIRFLTVSKAEHSPLSRELFHMSVRPW